MKLLKSLFGAAMSTALLLSLGSAYAQHSPISDEHVLKIGDKAPEFELPSQDPEKTVSLRELTKKGAVALVFHRSADW